MINLNPNCHFWGKFNEDAANKDVEDFSPKGNDGTSTRNTEDINDVGKIGGSFYFTPASSDKVDIGTLGNFGQNINDIFVSLWIKRPNTVPGRKLQSMCGYADGGNSQMIHFYINTYDGNQATGRLRCHLADSDDHNLIFGVNVDTGIIDNAWHHLVAVYKKSDNIGKVFVDNVPQTISYISQVAGTDFVNLNKGFWIGGQNPTGAYYRYNIDMFGLFDREPTVAEVAFLWNGGNGIEIINTVPRAIHHCKMAGAL